MAPAYLVTSFGELLRGAGHAAIVVIFGAVPAGLAGEAEGMRTHEVTTEAGTVACRLGPPSAAHPTVIAVRPDFLGSFSKLAPFLYHLRLSDRQPPASDEVL